MMLPLALLRHLSIALLLLYVVTQHALAQQHEVISDAQIPLPNDPLPIPSHVTPKIELGLASHELHADIDGGEVCDSNGVCRDDASVDVNENAPAGDEGDDQDESCIDNHESCSFWASEGECQNNPIYMQENCKKACGNCTEANNTEKIEQNRDSLTQTMTTITYISQLPFDENQKLESFQLVFPADNPNCSAAKSRSYYGYKKTALSGPALKLVFPAYTPDSNDDCVAACLERGTDHAVAGHIMPEFHYQQDRDGDFGNWFSARCTELEVCLMNYINQNNPIDVYWVEPASLKEHHQVSLEYGEQKTRCFHSFLGHNFKVYDNTTVVDSFTVEHLVTRPIGTFIRPPTESGTNFEGEILSTLNMEWRKHKVPKRTFSSLGFAKGKLPLDVYASMGSFYYNNRHHKSPEEWRNRGVFVNWYETDVFFIPIPWKLKGVWAARLADMVSKWAGVPVEETSMYGLRQYEDGARLLTHVDRLPTHAVSLIVNVAQGNLAEPWPVEVFDHADRLHEVVMEAGEVVYYESAKNLHSRNRPLKGNNAYFTNLFTHYRPIGDGDKWHEVLDQEGVPPPVGDDVVGECEVGKFDQDYPPYGKVKCEDKRLGQYLSPTLVQLKKAEDLIAWWRRTAPDYVEAGKFPINLMGMDEVVHDAPDYVEAGNSPMTPMGMDEFVHENAVYTIRKGRVNGKTAAKERKRVREALEQS